MPKITAATMNSPITPTWCPGCGNFGILGAIKQALTQLAYPEEDVVVLYGVGCGGNMADFNRVYGFHALHGRSIANAIGMKLANHKLKIIVVAGDGDTYGEGLNHLLSAARGNHDITVLVHNNQTYSLTTGQSSPTTDKGTKTKSTPTGLVEEPINPLALTLTAKASFVARAYAGQMKPMIELIKKGIKHEGFALVDVFQPCPTFNKVNTYQWYQEKVYDINDEDHDSTDLEAAWKRATEEDRLGVGVFYKNPRARAYHEYLSQLDKKTLYDQWSDSRNLDKAMKNFI